MHLNKTDITIETYNNIIPEYLNYYKTRNLGNGIQFQSEIDFLVDKLDNNAKILDAGTSIGAYPKYLTEQISKDFEVIGIDAAKNMIIKAKINAPKAHFKIMDIRNLTFSPLSFDAILCLATLIHVNNKDCIKILESFDRILKKTGYIVINVIESQGIQKETFLDEPLNPQYKTYINYYTQQFFIDYFKQHNYKILKLFDNPLFNPDELGEDINTNQFSIIVQKTT